MEFCNQQSAHSLEQNNENDKSCSQNNGIRFKSEKKDGYNWEYVSMWN